MNQEKSLDVVIEAGTRPRERIVFTGECSDQQEYAEAGDVHIQLNEADEEIPWKRDGNNLKASLAVNLRDSLLGSTKVIMDHPGFETGCTIVIPPGSIHQTVVVVKGAGMPVKGSGQKGDALITLLVTVDAAEQAAILKNHELLRTVLSPSV
jgi:DnaJ-class molecular chaperone